MYLIIILGSISLIISLLVAMLHDDSDYYSYDNMGKFGMFMVSIIMCFTVGVVIMLITSKKMYTIEPIEKSEILVSLEDNLETQGSFVLGCGNIEGALEYYAYKKENIGYSVLKISSDELTLIEVDRNYGEYVTYNTKWELKNWRYEYSYEKDNVLYIPKGTIIKNNFNLDLK